MPTLVTKNDCCGCSACASICSKSAITMESDIYGFLHPHINLNICVECGSCERVCPGLSPAKNQKAKLEVFIVQNKDSIVRYESTSGGAFSAIAAEIIDRGGVVFGAAFDNDYKVSHIYVDNIAGLQRFRNSKYVQSSINDSYKAARAFLRNGRYVCFSGTPCQINGLYKFLGTDFDKLITVDVVCKSVPSPLIFEKYIQFKKINEQQISDIVFRDKYRGFQYCTMAHYSTHNNYHLHKAEYRRGSESDEWLRLFLSGIMCRDSCIACPYQTKKRVGDFTLGDIWVTGDKEYDDNQGTTILHAWTQKAKILLDSIETLKIKQISPDNSRGAERNKQIKVPTNRSQFFSDAINLDCCTFFEKYAPYDFKIRLKNLTRLILWKLDLQSFVREIKHKIIHRKK